MPQAKKIVFSKKAAYRLGKIADYIYEQSRSEDLTLVYMGRLQEYMSDVLPRFPEAGRKAEACQQPQHSVFKDVPPDPLHRPDDERHHDEVEAILSSGTDDPAQLARAVEIFQETGSIDYAHTYALDLTAKAKAAIENVELDPHARELFLSMADFFVERLN